MICCTLKLCLVQSNFPDKAEKSNILHDVRRTKNGIHYVWCYSTKLSSIVFVESNLFSVFKNKNTRQIYLVYASHYTSRKVYKQAQMHWNNVTTRCKHCVIVFNYLFMESDSRGNFLKWCFPTYLWCCDTCITYIILRTMLTLIKQKLERNLIFYTNIKYAYIFHGIRLHKIYSLKMLQKKTLEM